MKHVRLLAPLVLALVSAFVRAAERPNILFIAVDDLRPEFGAYGFDYIKSPNLDRLAKSGMTFGRAYCQQAVCSPTRSSLLTGTRPDTTKVWDLVTHFRDALPDVVTLPQLFKNNGYFVQGMGKIYHGSLDDPKSWSVPWGTPKADTYALPENVKLNERRYGVDPDDDNAPVKAKGKGKGKAAADAAPKEKNIRGPAFEGADVPDNTFQDGKVAELALATLRDSARKRNRSSSRSVSSNRTFHSFRPRNTGISTIPQKSNSRRTSFDRRTRQITRSSLVASCAITMVSPRARFPTTSRASSNTATTRRSVTPTRRSASCSTNSTALISERTPS